MKPMWFTSAIFRKLITLLSLMMFWLSACVPIEQILPTITAQPTITASVTLPPPSNTPLLPSSTPSLASTFGPSATSTPQPALEAHAWQAAPVMVEAAILAADPVEQFGYTPFFVLYGDGLLVVRSCDEGECRYLQTQLNQEQLCLLINTIDKIGFLKVDPQSAFVPLGTGTEIRLHVRVYEENFIQIEDLNRWVERPDWYPSFAGCQNCFDQPNVDPAIANLYRLLSTYSLPEPSGLQTDRLALWLTQPVIMGTPQIWADDLIPLASLSQASLCPNDPARRQAVILEGAMAYSTASFLSGQQVPLYTDGQTTWQVQSRWLLPYEMPQTCDQPAGLYPPDQILEIAWQCEPFMGTIPTSTATITPTPSITPTPLR